MPRRHRSSCTHRTAGSPIAGVAGVAGVVGLAATIGIAGCIAQSPTAPAEPAPLASDQVLSSRALQRGAAPLRALNIVYIERELLAPDRPDGDRAAARRLDELGYPQLAGRVGEHAARVFKAHGIDALVEVVDAARAAPNVTPRPEFAIQRDTLVLQIVDARLVGSGEAGSVQMILHASLNRDPGFRPYWNGRFALRLGADPQRGTGPPLRADARFVEVMLATVADQLAAEKIAGVRP